MTMRKKWRAFPVPTERALWFYIIGSLWLLPALSSPGFRTFFFLHILLTTLGILADFFLTLRSDIVITWEGTQRLRIEKSQDWTLTIENRKPFSYSLTIMDDLPFSMGSSSLPLTVSCPPHALIRTHYTVFPMKRGTYELQEMYLWISGPLRLAKRPKRYPLPRTIHVFPDTSEAEKIGIMWAKPRYLQGLRRLRISGLGSEFQLLRAYQPGDDWRQIDWSATARHRKFQVRVYDQEIHQYLALVVDCGRHMGVRWKGKTRLDYAVATAFNVAMLSQIFGDRFKIVTYAHHILWRSGWFSRRQSMKLWMDKLYALDVHTEEPDYHSALVSLLHELHRQTIIIWLTSFSDIASTEHILPLFQKLGKRHRPILVNIQNPAWKDVLKRKPEHEEDAYAYTLALRTELRQKELREHFQKHGIVFLVPEDHEVISSTLSAYLKLRIHFLN